MRVGLVGSALSEDLGVLKREIEDRGHQAVIANPRKAPEYTLAAIGMPGMARGSHGGRPGAAPMLAFDHRDLAGFDSLYIGDLEGRDRFFRGYFDKEIWVSLRERYLNFAAAEVDAQAFQLSLLLAAAETVPTVNSAESILATRLRPYVQWKARRAGLPVWPFEITRGGAQDPSLRQRQLVSRLGAAEEARIDVPCFPRELKHTLSLVAEAPRVTWRIIAVRGAATSKMIVTEAGKRSVATAPAEAAALADRLLELFGLAVAEVRMAAESPSTQDSSAEGSQSDGPCGAGRSSGAASPSILDVSAFPRLAEFEETTGERAAALVAETLLGACRR